MADARSQGVEVTLAMQPALFYALMIEKSQLICQNTNLTPGTTNRQPFFTYMTGAADKDPRFARFELQISKSFKFTNLEAEILEF